jgi:hypothetical protein
MRIRGDSPFLELGDLETAGVHRATRALDNLLEHV